MKTTLFLNHNVGGYHHAWGMVPMGTTSEEIDVQLPNGVEVVETEGFSKAFEYEGDITASVLNKYNGEGWPRPYLVFCIDGIMYPKYMEILDDGIREVCYGKEALKESYKATRNGATE